MNEIIKVEYNNDRPTVLARDLHEFLEVQTPYHKWFPRMCEYGFVENVDYMTVDKNVLRSDGVKMPQIQHDAQLTIEMAKELCMLQRNERGKQARQYFIQLEKDWNSPEKVMARALQIADRKLHVLQTKIEQDKPLVTFANSIQVSKDSLLVREYCKLLRQSGIKMGERRMFQWLRDNKYLIGVRGSDYNSPTQKSMEMGLFEVKETTFQRPDEDIHIRRTTKITGKGQVYFLNKLKEERVLVNAG